MSLDECQESEPEVAAPSGPSLKRRAFWTTTLIVSIVVIIGLHAAAIAVFLAAVDQPEVAEAPPKTEPPVSRPAPPAAKPRPKHPTEVPSEPDDGKPKKEDNDEKPPPAGVPDGDLEGIAPPPRAVPDRPLIGETEEAPEPREVVYTAPLPHRPNRLPPPPKSWSTDWSRSGFLEVRVRAVAVRRLPTISTEQVRSLTPDEALVIWVEVRNTSADQTMNYTRWQPVTTGDCTLYTPARRPIGLFLFPVKQRYDWTEDYERVIEPGGEPILEPLFFRIPEDERVVTLQLSGKNVGEKFPFVFVIPAKAWSGE
jgi:hypothetical protein